MFVGHSQLKLSVGRFCEAPKNRSVIVRAPRKDLRSDAALHRQAPPDFSRT